MLNFDFVACFPLGLSVSSFNVTVIQPPGSYEEAFY